MWYDYPMKWEFDVTINVNIWYSKINKEIKVELKYKQASIFETIQFFKDIDTKWLWSWLERFLKKYSNANKITLWIIKVDKNTITRIFNIIKDTRFRGVFWDREQKYEWRSRPYNSILVLLSERLWIDPDTFQNRYTIEQMNYLLWWIVYNINEQSDEWKEINDREQFNKENADEDLLELIS